MRIARIAVSAASFNIDRPYSYRVPDEMSSLRPGMRVTVPFSRSNRACEGMVLAVTEGEYEGQLKSVASVLDPEPVLSPEQLKLLLWMRARCFAPAYDCIHAMLPAGVWYTMQHGYRVSGKTEKEAAYAAAGRSELAKSILDALYENGGEMLAGEIKTALGKEDISAPLKRLADAGAIEPFSREIRRVKDKTAAVAVLACEAGDALTAAAVKRKKAPMQAAVLQLLSEIGSAPVSEITYFTGCTSQTVRRLEKAGYVSIEYVEVLRRPENSARPQEKIKELSAAQKKVFEPLCALLRSGKPEAALLCGVTGSGKTAVYIKLIEQAVALGKTAMILVPEIVLTPQMVSIFSAHFGDAIAVLHSSLGLGERYDEWKRIRSGAVSVVIGTRSAVFAPLENLGIIIIDEEQEHTYKSENSPRYHARDIAKYRCAQSGALLLLGSATPSLESMYCAKNGKYHLFRLEGRYNKTVLPAVMTADMRSELKDGNDSTVSSVLARELRSNIERGEQSILFINRRGANSLIACGECGYVQKCPNCSVSMTYHSANKRLMCHYCGASRPVIKECPECGGILKFTGAGTQQAAEDIEKLFPGVQVLRIDSDVISASSTQDMLLAKFEREKIPILVGTQMVAKGLNLKNVTLVGVLSADQSLYANDYRARERTFSLITQVIGRSGRGEKAGRAVIQTFTPQNEVIRLASLQDYDGFYEREISLREALDAPPIRDVTVFTLSGAEEARVLRAATDVRKYLQKALPRECGERRILGPAPAPVVKVNNRFRYRVTLVCENTKELRNAAETLIKRFSAARQNKGISISADINPLE